MVYAKHLREAGTAFMKSVLGYDPGNGTGRERPREGGGAFLAVHLRREDYKQARPSQFFVCLFVVFCCIVVCLELGAFFVYCFVALFFCFCLQIICLLHWLIIVCLLLDDIPSLEGAARQIKVLKRSQGLSVVFLATDASFGGELLHASTIMPAIHS